MNFKALLLHAKNKELAAIHELLSMYQPLLLKESIVDGVFDEDLFQELSITLLNCIEKIRIR